MAVLRDQVGTAACKRRDELAHLRERLDRVHRICDHDPESRILRGQRLRLNEHHLALLLGAVALLVDGEAGVRDDPVGCVGLSDVRIGLVDLLGANLDADSHGKQHEGQPADHGGLPVTGAPPAHPSGEMRHVIRPCVADGGGFRGCRLVRLVLHDACLHHDSSRAAVYADQAVSHDPRPEDGRLAVWGAGFWCLPGAQERR